MSSTIDTGAGGSGTGDGVGAGGTLRIDSGASGCPVVTGNFTFGGERAPLESFGIYDEFNRAGPIVRVAEGIGYYVVTDREAVADISSNVDVFSNGYNPNLRVGGIGAPYPMKPLHLDPPEHRRWRRMMAPAFSPSAVRTWEPTIRERANHLIDDFVDSGRCDAIADFAKVLPTTIFLDFLGLPHADLPRFLVWEHAILHPGPDGTHAGLTREQAQAAVRDYFAAVIADQRSAGSGTGLVAEAITWDLDDDDLLSFCLLMFAAGLDTVTAELGYGLLHLATHPADRDRLAADPALVDDAVEELLRVYPIAATPRVAIRDTEVKGCPVNRGDYVVLGLAGTGRHPDYHEHATEVDLDRKRLPNTTFGLGPHRCVGAHLARLELRVAYQEWHRRIPEYRLADTSAVTETVSLTLGLNSLPLEWDTGHHR